MIEVEFCGRLSTPFNGVQMIDLPEGVKTVSDLRSHFERKFQTDALTHITIRAVVNESIVTDIHEVFDGDRIAFLPPVGGG